MQALITARGRPPAEGGRRWFPAATPLSGMQGHSARRATVNGMHSAEILSSSWSTDRTICVRAWRGKWRVIRNRSTAAVRGMRMCICVHSVRGSRARAERRPQPVTGTFV
jgi:hypothetical protein